MKQKEIKLIQSAVGKEIRRHNQLEGYGQLLRAIIGNTEIIEMVIKKNLIPRDYNVLEYRFGFKSGVNHKLNETGEKFDVTRERVRQIEAKSLEIIANTLKDYLTIGRES